MKLFLPFIFTLLIFVNVPASAQPLSIISTFKHYKESVTLDSKKALVDLKKVIPGIVIDLKYSNENNFTKTKLYSKATTTYLRRDVANALLKVNDELKTLGFGIKIFDAYRPYSVTKLMWDLIHDERYVANPINGSGHNKGIAVDLTIIKQNTGTELNMGTAFDNFTDSAHHSFTKNLSNEMIAHRTLLKTTMEKYGFKSLETEWWHYSFQSKENYEVMDIDLKVLNRKIK